MRSLFKTGFIPVLVVLGAVGAAGALIPGAGFRAGAARIAISPARDGAFSTEQYRTYVRAIVMDDGLEPAAIVTCDEVSLSHEFWWKVVSRISRDTHIRRERILLTAARPSLEPISADNAYVLTLEQRIVDVVRQAKGNMQPARVGAGVVADASDNVVSVVKFESTSGRPIAILSAGDVPAAVARFLEEHYGSEVVAPSTSGAAGEPYSGKGVTRLLAEEVIRAAESIRTTNDIVIHGAQRMVYCDRDSVSIRLSLMMIGRIPLAGVSGDVVTMLGHRLQRELPVSNTIMVTHCNGSSGHGCAENAIVNGFMEMMQRY